jgi:hypothetical protein
MWFGHATRHWWALIGGRLIQLADLSAMFYRQPRLFPFPVHLTGSERRFATVEARFGVGGLLASLPVRREVGHKSGFVVHLD